MTANFTSLDLDAVALNHRVCEQFVGDLGRQRFRFRGLGGRQIELEVFALPHVIDAVVAERVQRVGDGPALGVEHGRLERDKDARAHVSFLVNQTGWGTCSKTRSKMESTCLSWSSRLNARSMSPGGSTRVTSASASNSALKSRC